MFTASNLEVPTERLSHTSHLTYVTRPRRGTRQDNNRKGNKEREDTLQYSHLLSKGRGPEGPLLLCRMQVLGHYGVGYIDIVTCAVVGTKQSVADEEAVCHVRRLPHKRHGVSAGVVDYVVLD